MRNVSFSLCIGLILLLRALKRQKGVFHRAQLFNAKKLKILFLINSNIFIRTLCLIFTFTFFTAQGAKLGDTLLAANAVLLNFLMFMSYALDGFAHAAEALVGRALGAANQTLFRQVLSTTLLWSALIALGFTINYWLYGIALINLLTHLEPVRHAAYDYLPWLIIMPSLSFGCFLLDGIFIGATWSKEMRNTMLLATFACFLPVWYYTRFLHNHGLWLALCLFFLARTCFMGLVFLHKKSSS